MGGNMADVQGSPAKSHKRISGQQRKLIAGIASGLSIQRAALNAGYGGGTNAASASVAANAVLKNPKVTSELERAFDRAGASLDASARVVAHAHNAKITDEANHPVRLKAAELNLRARRLLAPTEESGGGTVNIAALLAIVKSESKKRGLPL